MKNRVLLTMVGIAVVGLTGCGYTGPASCQGGGCTVTHPDNSEAGVYFPSGSSACEAICDEVASCDGQAQGTVVDGELTGTSCAE